MASHLTNYIVAYGYLAFFVIILLQELGIPGLPNELVLFYFGYICRQTSLSYPIVICLVIFADILGSYLLFMLFYHGKDWLAKIKPRWIKIPDKKIESLKVKLASKNGKNIFIAKLTPFLRIYTSIAAGLLQIEPLLYSRIVFITAIIWSGGWVSAGWLFHF